jgi:hypothetical protein
MNDELHKLIDCVKADRQIAQLGLSNVADSLIAAHVFEYSPKTLDMEIRETFGLTKEHSIDAYNRETATANIVRRLPKRYLFTVVLSDSKHYAGTEVLCKTVDTFDITLRNPYHLNNIVTSKGSSASGYGFTLAIVPFYNIACTINAEEFYQATEGEGNTGSVAGEVPVGQ